MTRVLLLSRDFPPHKGGGVRRVGALARGLSERGYQVDTLAAFGNPTHLYRSSFDHMLQIARSVRLGRAYRAWSRWALVPDPAILDIPRILEAAPDPRPDVVIASAPPHSLLVAASLLSRRYNCPWIADYRDPWSDLPHLSAPTPLHRTAHQELEGRVLATSSGVMAATDAMQVWLHNRAPSHVPCVPFYNGYDPALFEAPKSRRKVGTVLGFFGSLYGPLDPEPLVEAAAAAGASLLFAGEDFDGKLRAAVHRHGVKADFRGVVSQAEAVRLMMEVDILTLILPDDDAWAYCRTQKLPEYLATGRPILAFAPEGEASQLIARYRAGRTVRPKDGKGAVRAIRELSSDPGEHLPPTELTWSNQLDRVAGFIEQVLSTR